MQSTSLTIVWHSCGLCSGDDMVMEKTTISRATNTIRIKQYNGYRELLRDEHVKVNANELHELFVLIDQILDDGTWLPDYSVEVCDGFMWYMYVRQGRSTPVKVHGTIEPPPFGLDIETRIRNMLQNTEAMIDPELFCACR